MTTARFVERQDAGTYRLGIRLLELGNLVKSRINMREVALPFMQELHESIGEAINLGAATTTKSSTSSAPPRDARWCASSIWSAAARRCT